MGLDVQFKKSTAEAYIDALFNRRPIPHPETLGDFFTLAGACFYVARFSPSEDWPRKTKEELGSEGWEAQLQLANAHGRAAIEFFATMCGLVYEKKYDAEYEPSVLLTIANEGEQTMIQFFRGKRGTGPDAK